MIPTPDPKHPINKRAATISSSITFGAGKKEFFQALLWRAIGTHCVYCRDMITLESASIDHIQPYGKTKLRANKLVQHALNRADNFQVICRKCNTMKGNLDAPRFKKLMDFLEQDLVLKEFIYKKLTQSSLMWSFRKKKLPY